MICPKCGHELEDGVCPDCGYSVFLMKERSEAHDGMRRLTVVPRDIAMSMLYAEIRGGGKTKWEKVGDAVRNWSVVIGGHGRRDRSGDGSDNIYDRDWKRKD